MHMAGEWVAAAGEGRTVNRDWPNKHRALVVDLAASKKLPVSVVIYQSVVL